MLSAAHDILMPEANVRAKYFLLCLVDWYSYVMLLFFIVSVAETGNIRRAFSCLYNVLLCKICNINLWQNEVLWFSNVFRFVPSNCRSAVCLPKCIFCGLLDF